MVSRRRVLPLSSLIGGRRALGAHGSPAAVDCHIVGVVSPAAAAIVGRNERRERQASAASDAACAAERVIVRKPALVFENRARVPFN